MSQQLNTEILTRAMELNPGEQIKIECSMEREMESVRVSLLNTKAKMEERGINLSNIKISRKSSIREDYFNVIIYKMGAFGNMSLISRDGKETPLEIICQEDSEMERICQLMEQDGKTKEEIEAWKKGFIEGKGE